MRSHAQRNYDRVIAAASAVFAESGPDASLNEIARRAEVGPGTLYRHFPTRQDLQAAVLKERIAALARHGEELSSAADAVAALVEWLRALLVHAKSDRGLGAAILTSAAHSEVDCHTVIREAAVELVERAQRVGAVRADVSIDDLIHLVAGIGLAAAHASDAGQPDRLLDLALTGLTTVPGTIAIHGTGSGEDAVP
ncbi:helix-turn-helix domain-containing protein [Nocardia sp. NPDC046763]|uniref:TetR/AcrR family transcriptional regulator n=1 Tax=Nocardia sp. NPDC046763 TaxID=3155256 RepID=UPI0034073FDA